MRLRFMIRDLFGLTLVMALAMSSCSTKSEPPSPRSDPTKGEEESREIPLSSVATTSSQFGREQMSIAYRDEGGQRKYTNKYGGYLAQILETISGHGASNVFLADAPDIDGAVGAAAGSIIGGRSADRPIPLNQSNRPTGNYWLVAYLGVGSSSGPAFIVDKATVQGAKIRLSYHNPKLTTATADIVPYLYWVPLGKLADGTYDLELYDSGRDLLTLMRRVVVGPSK
jgi:hypothetical protein